jgi:hypothetical protein
MASNGREKAIRHSFPANFFTPFLMFLEASQNSLPSRLIFILFTPAARAIVSKVAAL